MTPEEMIAALKYALEHDHALRTVLGLLIQQSAPAPALPPNILTTANLLTALAGPCDAYIRDRCYEAVRAAMGAAPTE